MGTTLTKIDWSKTQVCHKCPKILVPFGKGKKVKDLAPGHAFHSANGLCYNCRRAERDGYKNRSLIPEYNEQEGLLCKSCEEILPLSEFDTRKSGRKAPSCRTCNSLRYFYHITKKTYNSMLESQNFSCAICERHRAIIPGGLHIDHDHSCCNTKARSCGKCVRGLLCSKCNKAIGLLNDNVLIIKSAINYLEPSKE